MNTYPFYLIHTDVWGPSIVSNVSGARWFLTFIDDCTRVTWVFLLKQKSKVCYVVQHFFSMVKNQFGVSIKRIRSDNAKDYFNHGLISFCQKEGIIHESSCVKTPQQNGIAERKKEPKTSPAPLYEDLDISIALRKETRKCTTKLLYPLANYLSFRNFSPTHKAFLTSLNTTTTPTSLSEALSDKKWKQAMDVEMEALEKNSTWDLVALPILSLAANYGWNLQQFDVKNAFLHGEIKEEIYMEAANIVCKLKKALYGLKQSPRAWFGRFTTVMISLGFKQSQGDHTLFIKHSKSRGVTVLLVYVDVIIVIGDDEEEQQLLGQHLAKEFEIKTFEN
uniref:Retrovirus-related Pol polyprotein from transposon TNT 1-94 n=1 Tax=Cajanus cajan TaxID=3821 RepID=A0A151TAB2_CAJCA|nr:Retrovirus-related Pol polyprotein from transposon TNT 1-94 [Cajanus cajan]